MKPVSQSMSARMFSYSTMCVFPTSILLGLFGGLWNTLNSGIKGHQTNNAGNYSSSSYENGSGVWNSLCSYISKVYSAYSWIMENLTIWCYCFYCFYWKLQNNVKGIKAMYKYFFLIHHLKVYKIQNIHYVLLKVLFKLKFSQVK